MYRIVEIPLDGRTQVLSERRYSIVWKCEGDLPEALEREGMLPWHSVPYEGMTTANGITDARMPQKVLDEHTEHCKAENHKLTYKLNFIT